MDKYWPIEFFLSGLNDDRVEWLSDQAGILRSVFEVARFEDEFLINVANASCIVRRDGGALDVNCAEAENVASFSEKEKCVHFKDGTLLYLRMKEDIRAYHFCFEDNS